MMQNRIGGQNASFCMFCSLGHVSIVCNNTRLEILASESVSFAVLDAKDGQVASPSDIDHFLAELSLLSCPPKGMKIYHWQSERRLESDAVGHSERSN